MKFEILLFTAIALIPQADAAPTHWRAYLKDLRQLVPHNAQTSGQQDYRPPSITQELSQGRHLYITLYPVVIIGLDLPPPPYCEDDEETDAPIPGQDLRRDFFRWHVRI